MLVCLDIDRAGNVKGRKSQSSLKIEVDVCPLDSASCKQKARAHSSGEAEYFAAALATSETLLIREILMFMGMGVRTELLLDSAAARGICRRDGVETIRHQSTKLHWLQQLLKRGNGHGWSMFTCREPRRRGGQVAATAEAMERLGVGPT